MTADRQQATHDMDMTSQTAGLQKCRSAGAPSSGRTEMSPLSSLSKKAKMSFTFIPDSLAMIISFVSFSSGFIAAANPLLWLDSSPAVASLLPREKRAMDDLRRSSFATAALLAALKALSSGSSSLDFGPRELFIKLLRLLAARLGPPGGGVGSAARGESDDFVAI